MIISLIISPKQKGEDIKEEILDKEYLNNTENSQLSN